MKSVKNKIVIILFCVLGLSIWSDGSGRCSKNNFFCPNTTLNYTHDPDALKEAQRQFVKDVLSSKLLTRLTKEGRSLVNNIATLLNTDSPSQLFGYYIFTMWSLFFLADPFEYPSLCVVAENINSSVNLAKQGNIEITKNALLKYGKSFHSVCRMVHLNSLYQLGCCHVPEFPTLYMRCYKRGHVYEVHENLELFGLYLPCCIHENILNLYSSKIYADNVLAAMFSMSLTPEIREHTFYLDQDILLETLNMLVHNDVSVCCCSKRNKRLHNLCSLLNNTAIHTTETMINDLVDQCSTEDNINN